MTCQRPTQGPSGALYVFEGPDGVGKSGVLASIADVLKTQFNTSLVLASFPGQEAGTIGKLVYDLHHSPTVFGISGVTSTSLQVLHVAAHVDTIERHILPHLQRGGTVLLDRFWWSTWTYGRIARIDDEVLLSMIDIERRCWGGVLPDAVFLFDRTEPLRPEVNTSHFQALRIAYRELAVREEARYPVHWLTEHESASRSVVEALTHIRRHSETASRRGMHGGEEPPTASVRPVTARGQEPPGSDR